MTKKYDKEEAKKAILGTLEERTIKYAQQFGNEKADQVAQKLRVDYRTAAKDPLTVLDEVCSEKSLEEKALVPYKSKSSAYRTIADVVGTIGEGTLTAINKTRWYYPILGALPHKYQMGVARKINDDLRKYVISNAILESVALGVVGGLLFGPWVLPPVVAYSVVINAVRMDLAKEDDSPFEDNDSTSFGSPLVTIPYYLALGTVLGISTAGKGIKNSYSSAWEKRKALTSEIKRLENNHLRIEPAEPTQIVDAEFAEAEQEVEESLAPVKRNYDFGK